LLYPTELLFHFTKEVIGKVCFLKGSLEVT
jgi:hypothetical protein